MNKLRRPFGFVAAIVALLPAVASAHPGHDDGHELTWDLSHLAAHPLATLSCGLVIGAMAALLWRAMSRTVVKARRDSSR